MSFKAGTLFAVVDTRLHLRFPIAYLRQCHFCNEAYCTNRRGSWLEQRRQIYCSSRCGDADYLNHGIRRTPSKPSPLNLFWKLMQFAITCLAVWAVVAAICLL